MDYVVIFHIKGLSKLAYSRKIKILIYFIHTYEIIKVNERENM